MCIGVAGVHHNCDYCRGGVKGTESELISLHLKKFDHFVKIIHIQSHTEEAHVLNHVVTHKIHVVAVGIHQNMVFHHFSAEMVLNLQIQLELYSQKLVSLQNSLKQKLKKENN